MIFLHFYSRLLKWLVRTSDVTVRKRFSSPKNGRNVPLESQLSCCTFGERGPWSSRDEDHSLTWLCTGSLDGSLSPFVSSEKVQMCRFFRVPHDSNTVVPEGKKNSFTQNLRSSIKYSSLWLHFFITLSIYWSLQLFKAYQTELHHPKTGLQFIYHAPLHQDAFWLIKLGRWRSPWTNRGKALISK